jgi:hypothetical protein
MFLLSLMSYVIKSQINSGLVLWCLTPQSTLFRAHLRARFELTFIVVIGTDCTGNCNPTTFTKVQLISLKQICLMLDFLIGEYRGGVIKRHIAIFLTLLKRLHQGL